MKKIFLYHFLLIATMVRGQVKLVETDQLPSKNPEWIKATDSANWRPRDSSGELVFKNKMWIMGGWHNSFEAPPRDVWSSLDGINWENVTTNAPWKHSDFPMTITFKNRMWVMGGWFNGRLPGHSASNKVWSSKNGRKWKQQIDSAAWTPRIGAGLIEFKGKMWLLGGTENYYFGDSSSLKNDVWVSDNGKDWGLATEHAGWSPRAFHACVVFDNKIWIIGGGNYVPTYQALNDVWCSADGVNWTLVTEHAPWSARIWFSSVVYKDRLWILGGWSNNPSRNWNDVWYSQDGNVWEQLPSNKTWTPRHEHSTYVFKNKIWVAGGNTSPLTNEVWSIEIPDAVLRKE